MRVCLLSMTDSAGQNYLLADAMRKYLGWDAKSFSISQTYLDYPTDGIILQGEVDGFWSEVNEFAKSADLFIFQDILFRVPGMKIDKLANKNNTIIYGLGSPMRNNLSAIMDYVKVGYHVLPPLSDPTISRYIGGAPFEAVIVDPRVWEQPVKRNDRITICHAPTKTEKGEELFAKLVTEIEDVDWLVIKGKTWKEALELKSKAHIMLDSISDESYGLNCLEGLVLGQSVISSIAPWCYCLNQELGMRTIWKNRNGEIVYAIQDEVDQWNNMYTMARENAFDNRVKIRRDSINKTYGPNAQAIKWKMYIDWCMRG